MYLGNYKHFLIGNGFWSVEKDKKNYALIFKFVLMSLYILKCTLPIRINTYVLSIMYLEITNFFHSIDNIFYYFFNLCGTIIVLE